MTKRVLFTWVKENHGSQAHELLLVHIVASEWLDYIVKHSGRYPINVTPWSHWTWKKEKFSAQNDIFKLAKGYIWLHQMNLFPSTAFLWTLYLRRIISTRKFQYLRSKVVNNNIILWEIESLNRFIVCITIFIVNYKQTDTWHQTSPPNHMGLVFTQAPCLVS